MPVAKLHWRQRAWDGSSGRSFALNLPEMAVSEFEIELPQGAEVPIHSVRAGGYVGVHTVLLASDDERLSLTHESFSRRAFVSGALTAAKFILGRTGWYDMEDVLGLTERLESAASAV